MKSRALDPQRIAPNRHVVHPFDFQHGLDTGGYLSPPEIVTGHPHDALQYGYSAIAPSVFRAAALRWSETLPPGTNLKACTFVDLGAGKGRALLLASELPFRKVIGVELSANLASIARNNAARWHALHSACAPIRVRNEDALRFDWPSPPLLVYLYNPFDCWLIEKVLERLERRATRAKKPGAARFDLLYVNPTCADVLSRRRTFSLLWTGRIDMDEADQVADPYGTTFDRVSIYRLRSP
jgi:SAM-dependent methyltransferase